MPRQPKHIPLPGVAPKMALSTKVAKDIAKLVQTEAGIRIDAANHQFITFRLERRLQELGLPSFEAYRDLLLGPGSDPEKRRLVEMLVTHTTSFFREPGHYDWLARTGLPQLVERGAGKLQPLLIWSAACSTGPELWSAGMVIDKFSTSIPGGLRWGLLGSDVSTGVLRRAAAAVFTSSEMSGLSDEQMRKYFLRSRPGADLAQGQRIYRVAPELRSRASFQQANLLQSLGDIPLADVVFLRNVLIYFSTEDRSRAIANIHARMRPGSFLFLGHSDTLQGVEIDLKPCGLSVFRKE